MSLTIRTFINGLVVVLTCVPSLAFSQPQNGCPNPDGVVLQVLGSGGPIADDGRASSGYLVWVDGKSRVLIDAGGGVFLRFGEAQARFTDLDFIGLSHLHTDHSADFPALLKSGNFSGRKRSLAIAGPDGDGVFPGLKSFLQSMLGKNDGAYAYLDSYLTGAAGTPTLNAREVAEGDSKTVYKSDDLRVDALRVPHGIVPAVAFRVSVGDESLVFATDQNGGDPAFADFARDASILVMHMVVPEGISGVGRRLHAPPSVIGEIAAEADPDTLVLSHFMARSLRNLDDNVAEVRKHFAGKVVLAEDLFCVSP
jgi:ribonuclease BN (tRNA processing enzyme)